MSRPAVATLALLIGLMVGSCAGWAAGRFQTERLVFERRYNQDVDLVMPALAADPAFRRLEPSTSR